MRDMRPELPSNRSAFPILCQYSVRREDCHETVQWRLPEHTTARRPDAFQSLR
jgi:hypothetical protein